MLLIPCPWCGPRAEPEFQCGGEPALRPVPAAAVSDQAWAGYLFLRSNEKGTHRELWCHAGGCGRWFVMQRDTVSHRILGSEKPGGEP